MSYQIRPREDEGLDSVVTGRGYVPRPQLHSVPIITGHYTGNQIRYNGYSTEQVDAVIRAIESWQRARPANESAPFEYNYVIPQNTSNYVHEYAGQYQGAHSAGENPYAVGVLFLNGVGEPLTDIQINKYRWLRDNYLIPNHVVAITPQELPHNAMPDAKTVCPGVAIMPEYHLLKEPYIPTPPLPPIPKGTPEMILLEVGVLVAVYDGTHLAHLQSGNIQTRLKAIGVPTISYGPRTATTDDEMWRYVISSTPTTPSPGAAYVGDKAHAEWTRRYQLAQLNQPPK